MKTGTSSLNPYAASYIPLSRRGAVDENKGYRLTTKDSKSGNEAIWSGLHSEDMTQNQYQNKESQDYNARGGEILPLSEDSTLRAHSIYGSYGSSSHNPSKMTQKQILDEEVDMDMAYLQMTFPGISEESLNGVYVANRGDLEATVDMLSQLELYTVDSSEVLPDTLDIGDVSEPGSSSEVASRKLKQVEGEVGGSSSGYSDSTHVT